MDWKKDKTLGYVYTLDKSSPYANSQGKVYQHIYVMCEHIGRTLEHNECVHHIDRDRSNNNLCNLMLLTNREHAKLHAIEDRGFKTEKRICLFCKNGFIVSVRSNQIYCSEACARKDRTKFEIDPQELEALVWEMPTTKVAELLGVSDVAVAKRCKKYNISKPPRGYWAKVQAGKQ